MKTNPINTIKAGIMAVALYLGIAAAAQAGGPALLQLPIEGVTKENRAQCKKLLEEKLGSVLGNWGNGAAGGDVKMINPLITP